MRRPEAGMPESYSRFSEIRGFRVRPFPREAGSVEQVSSGHERHFVQEETNDVRDQRQECREDQKCRVLAERPHEKRGNMFCETGGCGALHGTVTFFSAKIGEISRVGAR